MNFNFIALALPMVFFCPMVTAQIDNERAAPMTYSMLRSETAAENARAVTEPARVDWIKIQDRGRSLLDIQKRSQTVAINLQSIGTGVADRAQILVETTERASIKLQNITKLALDANNAANEAVIAAGAISQYLAETYTGAAYREQMTLPGVNHLLRAQEAEKLLDVKRQKRIMILKNARTFNVEMRKAQLTHRKLLADFQTADSQGKDSMSLATEADLAAARVATVGAQAASAFSDAAQLAALELKLARVAVEAQTLVANEAVTRAEMLAKKP